MKYLLLLTLLFSCGKSDKYKAEQYTIVDFAADPWNNNYAKVTAFRVIQDTTMDVTDSSDNKIVTERKLTRDTFYWIFVYDTVRNEKKIPEIDSTSGKVKMNWFPVPVLKKFVIRDYNINLEQRFPRIQPK